MQRRRQRAGMVLDRIAERPERPGRQQVVTRTAENAGAPCGSAPEGSHERRLARAGLTMDQDDRAPALDRVVKRPLEGLKFSCPFEEALAHLASVAHHATLVDLENTAGAGSRPVARPFSLGRPRPRGDPVRRPARYSSRSRGSLRYVTGRWRHARVRVGARERPLDRSTARTRRNHEEPLQQQRGDHGSSSRTDVACQMSVRREEPRIRKLHEAAARWWQEHRCR